MDWDQYEHDSRLRVPIDMHLLNPAECELYSQTIISHRQYWKVRDHNVGFYTLGTPAYLDASRSVDRYCQLSHENNIIVAPICRSLLGLVMRHICSAMQINQIRSRHLPESAYPGFHIFRHTGLTS